MTVLAAVFVSGASVFAVLRKSRLRKQLLRIRPENGKKKKLSERMVPGVDEALCSAGLHIKSRRFIALWLFSIALSASAGVFSGMPVPAAVLLTVTVCTAPCIFLIIKKKSRIRKFESQLADAVSVLAGALKTGYSFQGALRSVCSCSPSPLKEEFETVSYETSMGVSLEESLSNLMKRVPGQDLKMLCTAVSIQSSMGGDLTLILANLASVIRSRARIRREIRSKTAGGRLSGFIVGALPFILFLALKIISPEYIEPFLASQAGKAAVTAGVFLMIAGALLIRKITDVKY